jgi:hypothetical protein
MRIWQAKQGVYSFQGNVWLIRPDRTWDNMFTEVKGLHTVSQKLVLKLFLMILERTLDLLMFLWGIL